MKLYGVISPAGKIVGFDYTKWSAWMTAFCSQPQEFRMRNWHRVVASRRAMRRAGWRVVTGCFKIDAKP